MLYYTGIGSRETPPPILELIKQVSHELNVAGYILRSGGARGADTAFECAATNKEIFLPWFGFNGSLSEFKQPKPEAYKMASLIHPAWSHLRDSVKALHARNVHQILGWDLATPSQFVICWTKDGANGTTIPVTQSTGGTGTAITLASSLGIDVINLRNFNDESND